MTAIFNVINQYLFAPVLRLFTNMMGGSYAAGIFFFTVVINLVLIPLSIKSQKASVQQIKLKPKLDALKRKYGDDKQKYQSAMQKLYAEENVSMGGGCLPMIIRMVLILSVYYLVISPLTYLAKMDAATLSELESTFSINGIRGELELIKHASESPVITDAIKNIDFTLFGNIDLAKEVKFSLDFSTFSILWVIPFAAFAAAMFSSIISLVQQKRINPDAPNMAGMMLTMPIMSLVISFAAPAALGFYWACSSLVGGLIQAGVQEFYGPHKIIAKDEAKAIIKTATKEKKLLSEKHKTKE